MRPGHHCNEWRAQASFHCSMVSALPRSCRPAPGSPKFGTVVARENQQRAICYSEGIDRVQDLAYAMIHFGERVPKSPAPVRPVKLTCGIVG
jgi:hypothetical protein